MSAFAVLIVPGPSVLYVVGRSVARGRRAGLLAVVAVDGGYLAQVVAVAVGLGAVVSRSDAALTAVRVVGLVYLVVLGVRAWRQRSALAAEARSGRAVTGPSTVLREGAVVGALNPKRLLLLVALLPLDPGDDRSTPVLLGHGLAVAATAVFADVLWALVADRAGPWLRARPVRLERLGAAAGVVMLALAVRLAVAIATA